ncbi:tetratricopeptide repeat protein [Nonomuraea sp. NPDC046802]|uniref:tetratricopeptide repeat protein n=1 Tax=Nonomuraea sp. NPDC046802 TaxID=3154919 RepID=UPI0033E27B62
MTFLSPRDRVRFRVSRLYRRAGAHLPELGLGGLITAGGTFLLLQEELIKQLVGGFPTWLLAVLALPLPVAAGWLTHFVRRSRQAPPPPPLSGRLPFPERIDELIGRQDKLQQVIDRAGEHGVVVVQGQVGMGTSAVAIAAAWHLAGDTNKQRYADLRGPDRDHPETPLSVAQRVLRTLGQRPGAIQEAEDATPQVINVLTGSECVLLLDNVSTWSQIAWLPPRVPDVRIVVAGSFTDGLPQHIEPIELGKLALVDGQALLARHVDDERVKRDPKALELLVDSCLGSPSEIVRIGRWLGRNPNVALQDLVDDLGRLSIDEKLEFVLNLSVNQLRPTAKQLLVLLTGLPIAEVDHQAAAALLGLPSAEDAIKELAELGLVENVRMTRVRVHSAFRSGGADDSQQLDAAWRRLVEYFADQADAYADRLPAEDARTWFAIEDRVLLQVLTRDSPVRKTIRALGRIADGLETWFRLEQRHEDRLRAARALATAAARLHDEQVQATAELRQCAILLTLGNPRAAHEHFNQAAALRGKGDSWPELHLEHAAILLADGDEFTAVESALVHYGQALAGGDVAGHALRLINVAALLIRKGQTLDHDGRHKEAGRLYTDARAVLLVSLEAPRAADPSAKAHAMELLALAYYYLGMTREASTQLEHAERLYATTDDEFGRARCLVQRAGAQLEKPDHVPEEVAKLLEEAEPRLPPTGVSTALAHLHLGRLRHEHVERHREAGLEALSPWDGIAEPRQITELRACLRAL